MPYQIKTTFAHPEQLRRAVDGSTTHMERIPGHPTRPARAIDYSTWWEPIDAVDAAAAVAAGHVVRLAPTLPVL